MAVYNASEERCKSCNRLQPAAPQALHDGCHLVGLSRMIDDAHQLGQHAFFVEVGSEGHFGVGLLLCEDGEDGVWLVADGVDHVDTCRTSEQDGRDDAWKQHHVACCEDGHVAVEVGAEHLLDIVAVVGYHRKCAVAYVVHYLYLLRFWSAKVVIKIQILHLFMFNYEL